MTYLFNNIAEMTQYFYKQAERARATALAQMRAKRRDSLQAEAYGWESAARVVEAAHFKESFNFINMVKSLYNIDAHMLPELDEKQWIMFRIDPPRYLIQAPDSLADAILREVMKRQKETPE